jgi:predicted ATP-dependent endonuclease of OLD family
MGQNSMRIQTIHIRRFRGVQSADVEQCAGLNVFIGRNNAGKSTILAAAELVLGCITKPGLVGLWPVERPKDELFERNVDKNFEIGVTFNVDKQVIDTLIDNIASESPGIRNTVEPLRSYNEVSLIISGLYIEGEIITAIRSISIGKINEIDGELACVGTTLLQLNNMAMLELAERDKLVRRYAHDLDAVSRIDNNMLEYSYRERPPSQRQSFRVRDVYMRAQPSPETVKKLDRLFADAKDAEAAIGIIEIVKNDIRSEITNLKIADIESEIAVISGAVLSIPSYIYVLLRMLSSGNLISFKERRSQIGREEATQILKLKTQRGGAEALSRIQSTVRELLGVTVDAFQAEQSQDRVSRPLAEAEMDIDNFLVEANGAGIREALRIILDLELKSPTFALIEEPEVHLHPGLERVLHGYLVSKSQSMQLFVATHSPNFLDASNSQNVYLVSRSVAKGSKIERVASESDLIRISDEVGLKPSTVLMFDRLIFVEGVSDQAILTEFVKTMKCDFGATNSAFVIMGGGARLNQFAAESTLDLLSRRRIPMEFIIDKDERESADIKKIVDRVGDRATVRVLERREIENYLLKPFAIHKLLSDKAKRAGKEFEHSVEDLTNAIQAVAEEGLERLVHLVVSKRLLGPLYPNQGDGPAVDRLTSAKDAIETRIAEAATVEATVRAEISINWPQTANTRVPGSYILETLFQRYGFKYKKDSDGSALAALIGADDIDPEVKRMIKSILCI